jgi:hypothetical protein
MGIVISFNEARRRMSGNAEGAYIPKNKTYFKHISKCGTFDYTELYDALFDGSRDIHFDWKAAIGLSRNQILNRLRGQVAFSLDEMDALIEFLNIPGSEVSRVFFKVV